MKRLGNQTLAIGIASILALYASGLAVPSLTAIPAFATSSNDSNNNHHNDDRHHFSNRELRFVEEVIQCFTNNDHNNDHHNDGHFSHDVKQCIHDEIDHFFNNDNR
jgi:hypothetical protein